MSCGKGLPSGHRASQTMAYSTGNCYDETDTDSEGGPRLSDEQRLFVVVTGRAGGSARGSYLAKRRKRGADAAQERKALARRRDDRGLQALRRVVHAHRDIGEQAVDTLNLCRREVRGAGGLFAALLEFRQERLDLAVEVRCHLVHTSGGAGANNSE